MNAINGQPYSYFGFELSKIEGVLDMPSRLGDTIYDWGDYIEPLVDEKDIFWKDREIKIDVFFDGERYGMNFNQSLERLNALPDGFTLNTNYGNFTVKLKQAIKSKGFTNKYAKLKLVFTENVPQFTTASIGLPIGGNGISIDGFDLFNDFGILVSNIKLLDNIPLLKQSNVTVFNTSKPFNENRLIKTIEFSCVKVYNDFLQLRETTDKFKKLLSQKDYRILTYNGKNYNCFITDGFVVRVFKNHIKFNLKLNIIANFVDDGFVESGFAN